MSDEPKIHLPGMVAAYRGPVSDTEPPPAPDDEPTLPAPITCAVCQAWEGTSYAKRHTTPVPAHEALSLLALGYWTASNRAGTLCEPHTHMMTHLTRLEAERVAQVQAKQSKAPPSSLDRARREYETRAANLGKLACPDCGTWVNRGEVHACSGVP